jgi:potassium-transporting ATPase KdpC subunit
MKEFVRSLIVFVAMSLCTGLAYPFIITGLSHLELLNQARGSLVYSGERIVGSSLIGQHFTSPRYVHGRPSAMEKPYDASNSGGSNSGPSNAGFLSEAGKRVKTVRRENGLSHDAPIPADLVLASGSGLDPHISPEAAMIQADRVAGARNLSLPEVQWAIRKNSEAPLFRFLGTERVNVLALNRTLDDLSLERRRTQVTK